VYLVHLTGCAETVDVAAASAKARATIIAFIACPSGSRSAEPAELGPNLPSTPT
jgi:hypothetical protein